MLWSSAECKVDITSDVPGLKRPLFNLQSGHVYISYC